MRCVRTLALALGIAPVAQAGGSKPPPDPAAEYATQAGKLADRKDPKAWLGLASFAEEHLLWKQREEALRRILAFAPDCAEAHAQLDETKSGNAWIPVDEAEAKEIRDQQARGLIFYGSEWLPAEEAARLRKADRIAIGWDHEVRVETPDFVIYSERPLPSTRRLAGLMDNTAGFYRRFFGRVWKLAPRTRHVFYLFKNQASLNEHTKQFPAHSPDAPSFYSKDTKVVYLGEDKDLDSMILSRLCTRLNIKQANLPNDSLPEWLEDGLPGWVSYAHKGRRVIPGRCITPLATTFTAFGSQWPPKAPLSALVEGKDYAAQRGMNKHLSWAFVHFLVHGAGGTYRERFLSFLSTASQKSSKADLEKALGKKLADLDEDFRSYVENEFLLLASP